MVNIYPIVMCGGSGTRLWPLSRKSYPKQFANLIGDDSLFQQSLERTNCAGFHSPLIITSDDFRFIVSEQAESIGINNATVVIEPDTRNTAPAVLSAALILEKSDPKAVMLLSPSDHVIPDQAEFRNTVLSALALTQRNRIVTFGIKPDRPETGYGWLELGDKDSYGDIELKAFKEKPDLATAEAMMSSGQFLWNSGIFMFSASTIISAFETHAPEMLASVRKAVDESEKDLDFTRLGKEAWETIIGDSVDYVVMEKADNISVIPFTGEWSDLGDWDAVQRQTEQDENNVAMKGNATSVGCTNSLLRSEVDSMEVVGLGLDNIIVVAMPDAVLVADKNMTQEVKQVVSTLKEKQVRQSEVFLRDERHWGWFETLVLSDRYQVKKIVVKPGGVLSLQSHVHRAEHWIVVSGTARVTIDEEIKLITENQSVYIPLGAIHRMENPGKLPMELIEVQTGVYLGEDDIVRYEDVYARS